MTTTPHTETRLQAKPQLGRVIRTVTRRSFCTLATASATNRPHVAGVLYAADDHVLYVSTPARESKGTQCGREPRVFVCIPVRRLPMGPPSTVQFAATADILMPNDPEIARLVNSGRLKGITSHGELDLPDGCFLRITPDRTLHAYGLGLPIRRLIRDPLHAGGRVELA